MSWVLLNMIRNKKLYGFGTHRLKGQECIDAVTHALNSGYNLIDTAEKYYNGAEIGIAIKNSRKRRSKITIVHKLTDVLEFPRTAEATRDKVSGYLKELDTDYIDVLLMHGPSPRYHKNPEIFKEGNIRVWRAMYELKCEGVLKAIGVSNYNIEQMVYLIEAVGVVPDYLEVEYNIGNWHEMEQMRRWCERMGITIIGYSPLLAGELSHVLNDEDYKIRLAYSSEDMSEPEYCLRFCITQGVVPIPRSSNKGRIKQNLKSLKKGVFKWRP